jgi:hypothetical protein
VSAAGVEEERDRYKAALEEIVRTGYADKDGYWCQECGQEAQSAMHVAALRALGGVCEHVNSSEVRCYDCGEVLCKHADRDKKGRCYGCGDRLEDRVPQEKTA